MTDIGPGTRVECIRDDWGDQLFPVPANHPKVGGVYTVRAVRELRVVGLAFEGMPGTWWLAECFRPIGGTETGMKMIREAMKTKELVEGI